MEPGEGAASGAPFVSEATGQSVRRRWLLAGLALLLVLLPLPVGSNRPIFVAATVVALGLLGAVYWAACLHSRRSHAAGLGLGRVVPAAFALVCLTMLVQLLPLDAMGLSPKLPDGTRLSTFSFAPTATVLTLVQIAGYGAFALLVAQVATRWGGAMALLRVAILIAVLYAVVGLALLHQFGDSYFGITKEYYLGSATGPFINRNSFATFLAMGLAGGTALLCHSLAKRRGRPSLETVNIVTALLVIAIALFATNSRMGIFAGLTGGFVALTLGGLKARFRWWQWLLIVGALIGTGVLLAPELGAGVLDRLLDVDGALQQRVELYDQVVAMIAAHPWMGVGAGAFEWAFPAFHRATLTGAFVWDRAHSTYLTAWTELGIVGGTLAILIFVVLAARALRQAWKSSEHWAPGVAAVGTAWVMGVHSLVDFSLEIPANAIFLLTYLISGAAAQRTRAHVA